MKDLVYGIYGHEKKRTNTYKRLICSCDILALSLLLIFFRLVNGKYHYMGQDAVSHLNSFLLQGCLQRSIERLISSLPET